MSLTEIPVLVVPGGGGGGGGEGGGGGDKLRGGGRGGGRGRPAGNFVICKILVTSSHIFISAS